MSEDRVLQALKALAESDREREAPRAAEARLLREFRSHRARHRRRWLGIAAIAAGLVIAVSMSTKHAAPPEVSAVAPAIEIPPQAAPSVKAEAPIRRKVEGRTRPEPHEVVTDFFPLMDPAPPFERGQMLRVQLPAAAMRTVGLPVREDHLTDPVEADVLVGEEGMPRAIRFVRFDVQ